MSIPLGSVIPDSIIVDVASFFDEIDIRQFNLASPRANTLTDINRLMLKDFERFSVKYEKDMIIVDTSWDIYKNHRTSFHYHVTDESKAREKLTSILLKCRSIKTLRLTGIDLNEEFLEKLMKTNISECEIEKCVVEVGFDRFVEFLRHQKVSLHDVQLSNELLTNEILMLLSSAGVFRSWKSDCRSFDKSITYLSNEYLCQFMACWKTPYFNLRGFFTNFTVGCISHYARRASGKTDYGILSYNQLPVAIRYRNRNRHDTRLRSWNSHKSVYFHIYNYDHWHDTGETDTVPDVVFCVSLEQNGTGTITDATNPVEIVPPAEYALFKNFVKIMNGLPVETEEVNIACVYSFKFSYKKVARKGTQLKIIYEIRPIHGIGIDEAESEAEKDLADPIEHILVKTDVELIHLYSIIANILKACRCVTKIEFDGITLTDEFYALLKPFAERVTVNIWQGSLKLGSIYLSDDFLKLLALQGTQLPDQLCFKFCRTEFTAKGIQTFLEALEPRASLGKDCHYYLGVIDTSNLKDVFELVKAYEAVKTKKWSITKGETSILPERKELASDFSKPKCYDPFEEFFKPQKKPQCSQEKCVPKKDDWLDDYSMDMQPFYPSSTSITLTRGVYTENDDRWGRYYTPSFTVIFDYPRR